MEGAGTVELPGDSGALQAMGRAPRAERDQERQRAQASELRAQQLKQLTDALYVEMLRLQQEPARCKKWFYGPRADRLTSPGELAQMLLDFAGELERKPVNPDDIPESAAPVEEVRRVRRRPGRRALVNFDNLPVTTHLYELSAEQRACPGCGTERREIGQEEDWQIEYIPGHFQRLQHIRKTYARPACERQGAGANVETAAKPETAIEKGLAGPGLLAYIVTSKFADYLPLYRLEDIFGFLSEKCEGI